MAEKPEENNQNNDKSPPKNESEKQAVKIETVFEALRKDPKFKDLSDDQLSDLLYQTVQTSVSYSSQEVSQGPIPPPSFLQRYDELVPGSAKRIIDMAENNNYQKAELKKKLVENGIQQSNRGQILGFIISLLFIGGCVFCAFYGQTVPSSILGLAGGFSFVPSIWKLLQSYNQTESEDQE